MHRKKLMIPVLSGLVLVAFLVAAYSLWSSHQMTCSDRDKTLQVLQDIVVIATTPQPRSELTDAQRLRMAALQQRLLARVYSARC